VVYALISAGMNISDQRQMSEMATRILGFTPFQFKRRLVHAVMVAVAVLMVFLTILGALSR
jgi:hypothetical protein